MKPLCTLEELATAPVRGFQLGRTRVIVVRDSSGSCFIYRNHCPHRGVPLEWSPDQFLDESGSLLQCATHGALFLIDTGECVAGPCAGEHLQAVPWLLHEGSIWVQSPETCDD